MNKLRIDYNTRLFGGSRIRRAFHYSRFYAVTDAIKRYNLKYEKVLELGCFDGKFLDFLPSLPLVYKGFDANWEGGLNQAKKRELNNPKYEFNIAQKPEDMNLKNTEKFDLIVSMETFEHIPPELVCPYLKKLAKHLNGHLVITVPNEKGIFFLIKRLLKPKGPKNGMDSKFSFIDIINLTLGKTNYVKRHEHKGFDYDHLIYDIRKFFNVTSVSGYSINRFIPKSLSFGVCIVAENKY